MLELEQAKGLQKRKYLIRRRKALDASIKWISKSVVVQVFAAFWLLGICFNKSDVIIMYIYKLSYCYNISINHRKYVVENLSVYQFKCFNDGNVGYYINNKYIDQKIRELMHSIACLAAVLNIYSFAAINQYLERER